MVGRPKLLVGLYYVICFHSSPSLLASLLYFLYNFILSSPKHKYWGHLQRFTFAVAIGGTSLDGTSLDGTSRDGTSLGSESAAIDYGSGVLWIQILL